jgi:Protein of unknown function (DUF2384)
MSKPEPVNQRDAKPRRSQSMNFRKSSNGPPPTPDQSRRRSDLVQAAGRHFREAAPMSAFLNSRHEALEGQPLHLAIESDEGLRRVERLLQQLNA